MPVAGSTSQQRTCVGVGSGERRAQAAGEEGHGAGRRWRIERLEAREKGELGPRAWGCGDLAVPRCGDHVVLGGKRLQGRLDELSVNR